MKDIWVLIGGLVLILLLLFFVSYLQVRLDNSKRLRLEENIREIVKQELAYRDAMK